MTDDENVTFHLSSSHRNADVSFIINYVDPREPRRLETAFVRVDLADIPENDVDAHAFFLRLVEREIEDINDLEAFSACTRIADEMVWEVKSLRGHG